MKKLNESSVLNTKDETLANTARLLRQCSYDPAPDRILVNYGQGGQDELYLEVKFRMLWFLTWCKENGFNGFIDESEYEVIPSMGMVIAKAKVYVDGNLIGAAAASAVTNGDYAHNEKLIQTAATSAKGRALADAGFGTISSGLPSESGEIVPVDAGIKIIRDPVNPLVYKKIAVPAEKAPEEEAVEEPKKRARRKKAEIEAEKTVSEPAEEQPAEEQTTEEPAEPEEAEPVAEAPVQENPVTPAEPAAETAPEHQMTLEEAREFVIPIGTKYKGRKVWELLAEDLKTAQWIASDEFDKHGRWSALKTAVSIALAEANKYT